MSTYSIELIAKHANGIITKNLYNYRGIDSALSAVDRYCSFDERPFRTLEVEVRREGVPFLKACREGETFRYHSIDTFEFAEERASRAVGEERPQGVSETSRRVLEAAEKLLEQHRRMGEYEPDYHQPHLDEPVFLGPNRNPENDHAYGDL